MIEMNATIEHTTQYKNSPLGLIPEDWKVKHFEDISDIDKESLKSNTPKDYEFDYVSLSDVNSEEFKIETTRQVFESAPSRARRIVKKGDILMSTVRPNLQGFSLVKDDVKDLIASTGFAVITSKKCNNEFLYHFLFSDLINKQFHQLLVGSNYPAINSSDVKRLKLPIPSLPEQTAIADCLSTWDKAIEKLNALIAQKELSKKALMQQLLSGKKRLKGFEVEKGTHKTELGYKIPKDWQIVTVADLFSERSEKSNDQSEYPLFSLTIENGLTEKTDRYERSFLLKDKENNQYKVVHPNDILFNPMNLRFGAIAKSEILIKVLVSGYYNVITTKSEETNVNYFKELFKTPEFNNFYDRIAIGSLIEKKRVHLSNFIKLQVPFPSKEEQSAIATVLQCADDELQILKNKLEQLKKQKKGLMQVLLTGKKRLKF